MISSDVDILLAPVSPDAPCGVDLEAGDRYDPAFTELERSAQGKPEQQIGSTIVPAEEPDWKLVRRRATELLARSKDLRVACHLTRALLRTDGWTGFAQGLALLRGLVERYWETLYPALDPDDGDPQVRITSFMNITDDSVLATVRTMPLLASRSLGRFSLKDIEIAAGDAPPDKNASSPPTTASIEAIVMNCELPVLEEAATALGDCVEMLAALEAAIAAQVEVSKTPSFGKLSALLGKGRGFLRTRLATRAPGTAAAAAASEGAGNGERTAPSPSSPWTGAIASREDVIRAIDGISAYYVKHEPSNPIPLFMARCKRLVMMNFVDIVRELVPDAMKQIEALQGQVESGS
jgi:type VI secretion system protein ImpA